MLAVTTLQGDCRQVLKTLPEKSINCVVTSPPYWGQRVYLEDDSPYKAGEIGGEIKLTDYLVNMVEVFTEVYRVLRDDGTLWLNLGDKAAQDSKWGGGKSNAGKNYTSFDGGYRKHKLQSGLPNKNLIGLPWRVAFALQDTGWILRQDIIWHKPSALPESVTDRPTRCHEYIFLFSKNSKYYYDAQAIAEPSTGREKFGNMGSKVLTNSDRNDQNSRNLTITETRNKRSVWTVASQAYPGAHYAVFPEKLIEPCILAGCPIGGTVLDPFGGSGTTGRVALKHNRNAILIELNPEYHKQIDERTNGVQIQLAV